jgi:hypothetical protein
MSLKDFIDEKKFAIMFTLLVMALGTILYFATGAYAKSGSMDGQIIKNNDVTLYDTLRLKAIYNDEGYIDMFGLASANSLSKYSTTDGLPIPYPGMLVLGNAEGSMMLEEKEFSKIGDSVEDYGINFYVAGILSKTGTFIDDVHFVNIEEFNSLEGDSNLLTYRLTKDKVPKLFMLLDIRNRDAQIWQNIPSDINIAFDIHNIGQKSYYPVILGYSEAKMMIEEKLIVGTGSEIMDFFGRDVVIVGILSQTNSTLDMMHIVPNDFFDKVEGVLV